MQRVLGICFVCACVGGCPSQTPRQANSVPTARKARVPVEIPDNAVSPVSWKGVTMHAGDRVRLGKLAGTFGAKATGSVEVVAGRGHGGTMLTGEKRIGPPRWTPGEPISQIRVRWDAQQWKTEGGEPVTLEAFEATVHIELLDVVQ